ncbi:MAG TPA: LysR family transcriptional regulator [Methylocella sp.]|nr:LysR family transcriptional regulator [Methylocella sp.]
MEIHQINHFIAIVETGSFTKGADRAAVSQSAISASIAKLEMEFGVQLLDRRRTPVVPTDAGIRLLEASKSILQICKTVKGEIATIARPKLLRLGVLQSLSNRHPSSLLSAFQRMNAHLAIEVSDVASDELFDLLAEHQLDAALTILDDSPSRFARRVLFKEPYVLAVPDGHRFAKRESVKPEELHDEPFIVRSGCDRFLDASNALTSRGIRIRVVYRTSQIDRTMALVAAGIGLSFTPAMLAPGIKMVQVDDMDFLRSYGLLWLRERESDLKEFLDFASSHRWSPEAVQPA